MGRDVPYIAVFRDYPWLYVQGSPLEKFWGPHRVPGISQSFLSAVLKIKEFQLKKNNNLNLSYFFS